MEFDLRIVQETAAGSFSTIGSRGSLKGLIDSQHDAGGWPELIPGNYPLNISGDGMPDSWKTLKGLDSSKFQANGKDLSTGYDNLEVYLNSLVAPIVAAQIQ